ncbi:hypothetical protein [Streptomyces tanashiensis]|uniref:Uncharacterized protein n=1 Tax=Streptomyces tanashiensis TaxID=67367 RepID=A0ABY6QPP9_9ACTN|nr:hypothetical protein [Streptomyces tanashiensis]UZX19783.1 hypothetical protein LDH80_03110 [Streptomyces tanashiensis]
MPNFLLVRSSDHLLLGVSWSGLTVAETRPDGMPVLRATGEDARLVVSFPPQHVAEETSPAGQLPPAKTTASGTLVPVWKGMLSGPSRIAFALPQGTPLVPTVDGILQAMGRGRPIPADTAVELPWRMVFALQDHQGGQDITSDHPVLPLTVAGVSGLWRACLRASRREPGTPVQDASLALHAVNPATTQSPDPPFSVPLGQVGRERLAVNATPARPARATRLELSALGGTLTAAGRWDSFQWEHDAVLGRDVRVRMETSGVLYPLGHRARYVEFSERVFDPSAGHAAVLRSTFVLTVTEPVRRPPPDGPVARAFPFGDVEITTLVYGGLVGDGWQSFTDPATGQTHLGAYFKPVFADGNRTVEFPVRCAAPKGDVRFAIPLLFVADVAKPGFTSLTHPGLAQHLGTVLTPQSVRLPGIPIDLVRSAAPRDGDVHEVHGITVGGTLHATGYRPVLTGLDVRLPALRTLLGMDEPRRVEFTPEYVSQGASHDLVLKLDPPVDIDFVGKSDRSGGLVAPRFTTDAVSRDLGPVNSAARPAPGTGTIDPALLFPREATLLGFPLSDLVTGLKKPPTVISQLVPGRPPAARMVWNDVPLKASGPFRPDDGSTLDLTVTASADGTDTLCEVTDFALVLPSPSTPLLKVRFASMTFTQKSGGPPSIALKDTEVEFLGVLQLLQELGEAVDLADLDPEIEVSPDKLVASYSLPLPSVTAGAFVMANLEVSTEIAVPFDGKPVSVAFGFASRENPFTLTVLMFGGRGYLELELDHRGLRRLEAALEFGAMLAVDFVVARGEVHAFGGIRFELTDGEVTLTGYLRIGGCVEVLGLISVSVELCISLAYQSATKALVGRATLVIEVDFTLFSASVELDSGTWTLAGGGSADPADPAPPGPPAPDEGLARWRAYQAAFAPL